MVLFWKGPCNENRKSRNEGIHVGRPWPRPQLHPTKVWPWGEGLRFAHPLYPLCHPWKAPWLQDEGLESVLKDLNGVLFVVAFLSKDSQDLARTKVGYCKWAQKILFFTTSSYILTYVWKSNSFLMSCLLTIFQKKNMVSVFKKPRLKVSTSDTWLYYYSICLNPPSKRKMTPVAPRLDYVQPS